MRGSILLIVAVSVAMACVRPIVGEGDTHTTGTSTDADRGSTTGTTAVVDGGPSDTTAMGAQTTTSSGSGTTGAPASSTTDDDDPSLLLDVGLVPDVPNLPPFVPCPEGCDEGEYCSYCPEPFGKYHCLPFSELPECEDAPTCECILAAGYASCEIDEDGLLLAEEVFCDSPGK